ncbi:transmembrane protein 135-like [Saccoglossus kowalevskii]
MCTTIKTIICLLRLHVHHSPAPLPYYIPFAGGFFGALAGLQFESPRRRGELAMYVASIALDAVFICGRDAGIFKPLPYGSLLIFVVSMAVITHAYERDKDTLSPLLKGGMTFLCGKPENQKNGATYILAGVLASLTIAIDNTDRRKTLAMFLFSRALGAVCNALVRHGYMPSVPLGDSLAFSAGTGIILIGLALKPELLPKNYYFTLLKWARDYTDNLKALVSSPVPTLLVVFLKFVKSTTFLTVMCTTIKTIICLLRLHVHHSPAPLPYYIPFVGGFFGALAGLQFESPSRRGELAMYVTSIALDAVFIWGRDAGIFKPLPYGSLLIFVVSMAVITHAYERDRDTLSPMLNSGMTFLCGKPENQNVIKRNERITSAKRLHKEIPTE